MEYLTLDILIARLVQNHLRMHQEVDTPVHQILTILLILRKTQLPRCLPRLEHLLRNLTLIHFILSQQNRDFVRLFVESQSHHHHEETQVEDRFKIWLVYWAE